MYKSLEELRVQRELIQKHLEWLDLQIERIETDQAFESVTKKSSSAYSGIKDKVPLKKADTPALSISKTDSIVDNNRVDIPFSDTLDVRQIKFGCIAFFAIMTLLFLFILFALPYMIDWKVVD